MEVRRIVAHARAAWVVVCQKAWPHRHDRPTPCRERDTAAVAVLVVGGVAVNVIPVGTVRISVPRGNALEIATIDAGALMIGIGLVCEGRCEEHDRGKRSAALWQNVERQPILAGIACQMQRICAAAQVIRYRPGEVGLPVAVAQVIVMEMDCAIVVRRVTPAVLRAHPTRTNHSARRRVNQPAGASLWPDIRDDLGVDASRQVPAGKQVRCQCVQRHTWIDPRCNEAAQYGGILQLAGEMAGWCRSIFRRQQHLAAGRQPKSVRMNGGCRRRDAIQRLLPDQHATARRIHRQPHPIPARCSDRCASGDGDVIATPPDPGARAIGAQQQYNAGIIRFLRQQSLLAVNDTGPHQHGPAARHI